MPKIKEVTLTQNQLVEVSCKMHDLTNRKESQGYLEWLLFRAINDVLGINLFELEDDECLCGDKKSKDALLCDKCKSYENFNW